MSSPYLWLALFGLAAIIWVVALVARDPVGFFGALLRNLVVGCVALLVIDYLGKAAGIHVPLNLTSAGVAGVLGLPGIAALAVFEKWIL